MKLLKSGLLAAVVSVSALALGASAAQAGPVTGGLPFSASGTIALDGGLGGSTCDSTISGATDDAIDSITFTNCSGAAGTPTPQNLSWAITWSGNNGSTTAYAQATVFGRTCNYSGPVDVVYDGVSSISLSGLMTRTSGGFPCPGTADLTGEYSL